MARLQLSTKASPNEVFMRAKVVCSATTTGS